MRKHNVSHLPVHLLREFSSDGTVIPLLPAELIENELQDEADKVINSDFKKQRYLVKWLCNTWEAEKDLKHATDLLQGY